MAGAPIIRIVDLQFTWPGQSIACLDIAELAVGLKNRAAVFRMQREVNEYTGEPLLGVMPGVALDQLWQVVGVAERVLLAISAMVVAVGFAGLVAVVLAGLNERRRELAILRSVGARPRDIFLLLMMEAVGITVLGALAGIVLLAVLTAALAAARYGLIIELRFIGSGELLLLGTVVTVGVLASLLPGYRAYRISLADGLTPRIHVVPAKPYRLEQGVDAVWISGVLETIRAQTGMGNAGYRMKADVVAPFKR